jgi:toxin CcdB
MPQFDVHQNIAHNRRVVPYLLVVQSQRWSSYPTRLVVPMVPMTSGHLQDSALTPAFAIDGTELAVNPLQIFYIPLKSLGPVVGNLAEDTNAARIISALDEAIARGYR